MKTLVSTTTLTTTTIRIRTIVIITTEFMTTRATIRIKAKTTATTKSRKLGLN